MTEYFHIWLPLLLCLLAGLSPALPGKRPGWWLFLILCAAGVSAGLLLQTPMYTLSAGVLAAGTLAARLGERRAEK